MGISKILITSFLMFILLASNKFSSNLKLSLIEYKSFLVFFLGVSQTFFNELQIYTHKQNQLWSKVCPSNKKWGSWFIPRRWLIWFKMNSLPLTDIFWMSWFINSGLFYCLIASSISYFIIFSIILSSQSQS